MHDHVSTHDYHCVSQLLRAFFLKKGFLEAYSQNRLSILAACEDPFNITSFEYVNGVWPLPQTNQMWLEYELLNNPSLDKLFCFTTSYRQEQQPVPGRHNLIFPMFEFEARGTLKDLMELIQELCVYLGFDGSIKAISYHEACEALGVEVIDDAAEEALAKAHGDVVLLHHFPIHTSPFWNMKYEMKHKVASKVDTLLCGMETIGAAERSTDPDEMREVFYTISQGQYAKTLFDKFGKERVEKELEAFLSFPFFERFGGGIGLTRLIRALKQQNLLSYNPPLQQSA